MELQRILIPYDMVVLFQALTEIHFRKMVKDVLVPLKGILMAALSKIVYLSTHDLRYYNHMLRLNHSHSKKQFFLHSLFCCRIQTGFEKNLVLLVIDERFPMILSINFFSLAREREPRTAMPYPMEKKSKYPG